MIDVTERRLRVLVAEDETVIRLDLCSLLEQSGINVCAAARDGHEAVELARATRPDLAILDVRMPNVDGIEAARRILDDRPIPIVMLTAFADDETVAKAIDVGVFAYLTKPFREQDLLPAIRAALARYADLAASKRRAGRGRVDVLLPSGGGEGMWPLRLGRAADGSLDVSVLESRPSDR
jgi:response regulator NasT